MYVVRRRIGQKEDEQAGEERGGVEGKRGKGIGMRIRIRTKMKSKMEKQRAPARITKLTLT